MKCRFHILKAGRGFHIIGKCDHLWLTCCALHNMMLQCKEPTDDNMEEVLAAENAQFIEEDVEEAIPNPICMLYNLSELQSYDLTGHGRGNDQDANDETEESPGMGNWSIDEQLKQSKDENGVRNILLLSLPLFHKQLVQHFHVMFEQGQICWPGSHNVN